MNEFLRLKKRRLSRRIIEGAVTVLSLTALIVFCALKAESKIVATIDVTPFFSYDRIEYADDHAVGIIVSGLIFAFFAALLLADCLCARIRYTQIDEEDVIIYNELWPIRLSVGGEEKDAMFFKGYMEARLKSGVALTVAPQFFMSYHITFSDGRPAMDL